MQSTEPSSGAFTTSNYVAGSFVDKCGLVKKGPGRNARAQIYSIAQLLLRASYAAWVPHAAQQDVMPAVDHPAADQRSLCAVIEVE